MGEKIDYSFFLEILPIREMQKYSGSCSVKEFQSIRSKHNGNLIVLID